MAKDYLSLEGLSHFLDKLTETFSTIQHTHTKKEISDFPLIPTKISELTNDTHFVNTFTVNDDNNGNVVLGLE